MFVCKVFFHSFYSVRCSIHPNISQSILSQHLKTLSCYTLQCHIPSVTAKIPRGSNFKTSPQKSNFTLCWTKTLTTSLVLHTTTEVKRDHQVPHHPSLHIFKLCHSFKPNIMHFVRPATNLHTTFIDMLNVHYPVFISWKLENVECTHTPEVLGKRNCKLLEGRSAYFWKLEGGNLRFSRQKCMI